MRKGMRAVLLLAIVAAMLVTASIATPAPLDVRQPGFSVMTGLAMLQQTAVVLSLLFVWLIAAVVVTLMSAREVRYSSVELRASALHCFALGLVAITSFVLTAIVFSYFPSVVGVPLLIALAVFAIVAKIYGAIAVFHA